MPYLKLIFVMLLAVAAAPGALAEAPINLAAGGSGASVRAAGNIDSWIALTIVLSSLLTAWFLNYRAPRVRVFGTVLAAAGCLVIAAWFFFFVLPGGFLDNPKPNQTPLDSAKPALLWMQACFALLSGLALLLAAYRQGRSKEDLNLSARNEDSRYGKVSRALHWTIAILFIVLIPMGIFSSIIPEGTAYRTAYYVVHKTIGVIVFALLLVRLIWNTQSPRPALDAALTPRERKLAHAAHIGLYFLMLALPVTGFVMTSFHGYPTFFFAWELQPLWAPSDTATIYWGSLHKYLLPYLVYIVLGAHVLGALKHYFIDRHEYALKRMVG